MTSPTSSFARPEQGLGRFLVTREVLPSTSFARPEQGLGRFLVTREVLPSTSFARPEQGLGQVATIYLENPSPLSPPAAAASAAVAFDIVSLLPETLVLATVTVRALVGGTWETVFAAAAPGFGYAGGRQSVTTGELYEVSSFSFARADGWLPTRVEVEVEAANTGGAEIVPPARWAFDVLGAPPPPPEAFTLRDRDTIRGGALVAAYDPTGTRQLYDTSLDRPLTDATLPADWTGGRPGAAGVRLVGGDVFMHSASLTHFDAAMRARFARSVPGGVVRWAFEAGDDCIWVELGADGRLRSAIEVDGEVRASGGSSGPGPVAGRLRIVRNGPQAYAMFDDRVLAQGPVFRSGSGRLSLSVSGQVEVLARDFVVESHARIGERLLLDKRVAPRRILGRVPPATLAEVGPADYVLFGLFGEAVAEGGFEYLLPLGRAVGRDRTRALDTYQDARLRDGDE